MLRKLYPSVQRIDHLPSALLSKMSTNPDQYIFSETFRCFLPPSFYQTLLEELRIVSVFIDKGRTKAREMVWKELFALTDAKPVVCMKPFGPIVQSWSNGNSINPLAIELLFLSFMNSVEKHPSYFSFPIPPENPPTPTIEKRTPSPNPLPNIQQLFPSLVRNQPTPPPFYVPQLSLQKETEQQRTEDLKNLLDLQSWKLVLNELDPHTTSTIWKNWEAFTRCEAQQEGLSFSTIIDHWAKNILEFMPAIVCLHKVICFLGLDSFLRERVHGVSLKPSRFLDFRGNNSIYGGKRAPQHTFEEAKKMKLVA